jgi:hypothetical protein
MKTANADNMIKASLIAANQPSMQDEMIGMQRANVMPSLGPALSQAMSLPTKGAISNREMEMYQKASPSFDMVGDTKGAVSDRELAIAREAIEKTMSPEELNAAIEALMMQKQGTNDPEELEEIDEAIQSTIIQGQAPYNDLMNQLALTGGEDDMIAHVRTGDINLSRELVTPQIESLIEEQAMKSGIDPETIVFGQGIANLRNPITGQEQHGWLKKTAKSIKKKGRVIAQVASVVPGPWQIPATIATKAYTAYDVAKGNISPIQAAAQ